MRVFRFWTSHPNHDGASWARKLFLSDDVRLEFDAADPDYLFVGEQLYADSGNMRRFLELDDGRRVSVWHNGEAIFPDMNLFDYAFVFDRRSAVGDRICRLPTMAHFDSDDRFGPHERVDPAAELGRKTGFCNFIYANPEAHPRRDQIFHLLNGWRRVDALGPHLNNCGNASSRADADWARKLVEMKRPYKFSIAAENATYSGYVTEKICSSFRAHTVPIYWGDPAVAEDFNPKAFINANGLSDEDLLAEVRRIDGDDEAWMRMIAEPVQTPEQRASEAAAVRACREFAARVFDARPLQEKKRAPSGYWNGIYRGAVARQSAVRRRMGFPWRLFK